MVLDELSGARIWLLGVLPLSAFYGFAVCGANEVMLIRMEGG